MKGRHWILAAGLLALVVLPVLAQKVALPGQYIPGSVTPLPANPPEFGSLTGRIAKKTGLTELQVAAVIRELGPAMADRLARGQGFEIPGTGTFRLIRIVGHRELQGNVAVYVPARNSIEFIPSGTVDQTLNRAGAVAGVPVGQPDFNPQPGGGIPTTKQPSSRIPGPHEYP